MSPEKVAAFARSLAKTKESSNLSQEKKIGTFDLAIPTKQSASDSERPIPRSGHGQTLLGDKVKSKDSRKQDTAAPTDNSQPAPGPNSNDTSKTKSEGYSEDDFKEFLRPNDDTSKYKLVEYENAAEMLYTISPSLRSGAADLYSWQLEVHDFLTHEKFTQLVPLRFLLRAANGSGKDAYVIAPFAVWFALCKIRSRVIITSSSYKQLDTQTESYIKTICEQVNEFFGEEVFYIRKMHIVCKWTKSEIQMFVTDDEGRAEGYHPFPDHPGAEMCIIVNEAKTVKDEIFGALRRCTGYNYWIEVSSPGKTSGHFYNVVTQAVEWSPSLVVRHDIGYVTRKVTAYECEHFTKESIDLAATELGRNSPLFRSIYLAEFTSLDEAVIIPRELVDKVLLQKPAHLRLKNQANHKKCGVDLGFSRDETVAWVIDGNKLLDALIMIENDTTVQVERLCMFFEKHQLKGEDIAVDDSNFGHSVNDMLRLRGYEVRRVTNQSRPHNTKLFSNKGAEMWVNFKRMLELGLVAGLDSKNREQRVLIDQLSSRYYSQGDINGKIALESKAQARANGHGSPDRADALILAFSFYSINDFLEEAETIQETSRRQVKGLLALDFARKYEEEVQYKGLNSQTSSTENASTNSGRGILPTITSLVKRRLGKEGDGINKQFKSNGGVKGFKSIFD